MMQYHNLTRTAGVLLAIAALFVLSACGEQPAASKTAAVQNRPVLTQAAHFAPMSEARSFVATIKPRVEADMGFRVSGKVLKRLVDVGATANAGDVLAVLDETDLKLQLDQARAELQAAKGNATNADAELQRRTILNRQGYLTQASLDQQRTLADEAHGRLTKAERALQLAENALGYASLRAETDGIVTAALIEPGQVVAAGQTVIRVARTTEREALAAIPEALVSKVRSGTATVVLWSNPDKVQSAQLRELSPAADAATRTYAARFSLPDAGPEMAWGMTATVTIAEQGTGQAARLPLSSLFNQGSGPTVWVVDRATGTLTLKPVTVAKFDGTSVFISNGLTEGDDVVTLGVQKLDTGQKVRIVTALGT